VNATHALDRRAVAALLTTPIVTVLAQQFANAPTWLALAGGSPRDATVLLRARAWEVGLTFVLYAVVPLIVARVCGVRANELGLGFGESRRWLRVVALVLAVAVPLVIALSFTTRFQQVYPSFPAAVAGGPVLAGSLALLALLLLAVELLFRGFLLAMLRPALGGYALYVMIVPYALVHRDLVESLGAVGVGLLLGVLALRSRSIWPGWLAHTSVAFCIELCAVWQAHRR
jgi:membrane protease YdiL (CAAX protease family)